MNVIHQSNGKYRIDKNATKEDRIAAYFMKQIPKSDLTKKEQELVDRWVQVYTIKLNNFCSDHLAVQMHHTLCEESGHPISGRSALYDLSNAQKIFGDITKTTKEAKRAIFETWQTEVFRMAMKAGDIQGMNRAIKNLIDMHALNKPTAEGPDRREKPSMFVLAVYSKEADRPNIINLDEMGRVSKEQQNALLEMIDQEEITEIEMKALLEETDGDRES